MIRALQSSVTRVQRAFPSGGRRAARVGCLALLAAWAILARASAETNELGEINIAPFGSLSVADDSARGPSIDVSKFAQDSGTTLALAPGTRLLCEWRQPRDVRSVRLRFTGAAPDPGAITIEWWHRVWPDNGSGGWMKLDDPFNGNWATVNGLASANQSELRLPFPPLGTNEVPGLKHPGADFRHTYKLRISSSQPVTLQHLGLFTGATAKRARLRFEWNLKTTVPGTWSPKFEARNGRVLSVHPDGRNAVMVEVEYADSPDRLSADRGCVICRSGETRSFSVFVDDVRREGGLFVRDIGAFVCDAERHLTFATWRGPAGEAWPDTVEELVAKLPEQSLESVMRTTARKPPGDCFLGVPNLRQEIALSPKGDLILFADSLRSPGPDAEARPWTWSELRLQFGAGEHPTMGDADHRDVARHLEEGWLPVVRHEWTTGEIGYTETCVVTTLAGDIADLKDQVGTEPIVLSARFVLTNHAAEPRSACLWLEPNHPRPLRVAVDGTLVLDLPSDRKPRRGVIPVRGRFNTLGKGDLDLAVLIPGGPGSPNPDMKDSVSPRPAVRYRVQLGPHESHAIELAVPYVELLDEHDLAALKRVSFSQAHDSVVKFWKTRAGQGMTYQVPDPRLNNFFKANLWHVLISVDLDPINGLYEHGAATHVYGNFLNETAMVAHALEMRGEQDEAGRLLQPFLLCQGVKGLPGNFKTKDGVFYAAYPVEPDPYTAQGYNMHHGWGLWAAADHFFWTKDQAYLRENADRLIKACDWITRERQATKNTNPDGTRVVEYGLAPAGDLEDVDEWLYYYATDAYYYLGLKRAAAALTRAGHPEARRLTQQAADFLRDIQASVAESVSTSPVVRLRDGTYVPCVPPRAYALTHLKEGWIREGLYPALHLLDGEVYPVNHPFANWMIDDLEDNIFMSRESGYGLRNPRSDFFNLGGFTMQPNLLNLALDYLKRDEIPNFLRAFYNTFAVSLYPDTMCFAEWVPEFGKGGGPVYKTPDECKFIQWMRDLLVLERGEVLDLGLGVPRRWMADGQQIKIERAATYFGPVDLEIDSHAARGEAVARVRLGTTAAPGAIGLRLRSPDGRPIRSATVNGRAAKVDAKRQLIELPLNFAAWQVVAKF
ncbi:MAG: hypothetical protein ACYDH9_27080 [Limisphaerales bacterium]